MAKQGGKQKKSQKGKGKYDRTRKEQRTQKNKIKRVAQSSGFAAAMKYAAPHGLSKWAETRLRSFKHLAA